MRLVLTGRHLDISPGLRTLVDRKLVRLERLLGNAIVSAQVVCVREKDRLEADVTVHMRGDHMLASRATGATWSSALTTVVDKIERQGVKVKGKWKERKRRDPAPRRGAPAPSAPVDGRGARRRPAPRVVRVTRAQLKPMTVENAASSCPPPARRFSSSATPRPTRSTCCCGGEAASSACSSPSR